jgi:hypothetical protein
MRAKLVAIWSALALIAMLSLLGAGSALAGSGLGWDYGINALIMWWMTLCIAACCAVIAFTGRRIMLLGVACALVIILMLALDVDDGPQWLMWAMWFGAATVAEIGLLMLVRLRASPARLLRLATVASLLLFAAAMYPQASSVLDLSTPYDTWFERGIMALAILNAAGTLALFLVAWIESMTKPAPDTVPVNVALSAACPRCNASCTFPQGESACSSCGLRVTLEIQEPRCACGYLLYKLNSSHCPECGRAIRRTAPEPAPIAIS